MKPVWEDDKLCYLICFIESSTIKEAGNLRMFNKDRLTYEEYSFTTKRWERKTKEAPTERQRAILMLAGQGKCVREIANDLHRGYNTIHK
jgi:DNA-binding NarL/FixJ family response regulator